MLTGFLELYSGCVSVFVCVGVCVPVLWSTDNPLLRSDEDEKGYLG